MKNKNFTITKTERLDGSEVIIEGEVALELIDKHRALAIGKVKEQTTIDGFRKGKAPEHIVLERAGEMNILGEAAESAINEIFPSIIESEKLTIIGSPDISITKLALGNPVSFRMTLTTLPEFKLPDHKKLAAAEMKKEESIEVTDKDIDEVIEEIRHNYAHMELHKKIGDDNHNHAPIKPEDLPEFTEEFVKKIGDFADVADFRTKAKENLMTEKARRAHEKKRTSALEAIVEKTDVVAPKVLIESEIAKMLAEFHGEVERAGTTLEAYLEHIKKTEEDLRKEWRPVAEKRAKIQLIMNKIAEEEKILPDADKVRAETEKVLILYPNADPLRARAYIGQMLLNEAVLKFLEDQK